MAQVAGGEGLSNPGQVHDLIVVRGCSWILSGGVAALSHVSKGRVVCPVRDCGWDWDGGQRRAGAGEMKSWEESHQDLRMIAWGHEHRRGMEDSSWFCRLSNRGDEAICCSGNGGVWICRGQSTTLGVALK